MKNRIRFFSALENVFFFLTIALFIKWVKCDSFSGWYWFYSFLGTIFCNNMGEK